MLVILDANLGLKVKKPFILNTDGLGNWTEIYSPSLVWSHRK
jgi:hypothetical protein